MSLRRLAVIVAFRRGSPARSRSFFTSPSATWAGTRAASRPSSRSCSGGLSRSTARSSSRCCPRSPWLPSACAWATRTGARSRRWSRSGACRREIGLWSLVSGPVDVRSFELTDVSVLLETNAEGKGNWVFGEAGAPAEARRAGRRKRHRGAGGHPARQARQRADHLSRARQAGPGSAHRDAEHRPRFRRPARDLRKRQAERAAGRGERRARAHGGALRRAKHPHGDPGRGGRPAGRCQGRPRPPGSARRRRSRH